MQTFRVEDMTCGHCASTITQAIRALDSGARVEVDLQQHLVNIDSTGANVQALREAIAEAGYTPVAVEAAAIGAQPAAKRSGCCGCCG